MPRNRWKPGYAEKAYDMAVLLGLNPVPWQFDLMERKPGSHARSSTAEPNATATASPPKPARCARASDAPNATRRHANDDCP